MSDWSFSLDRSTGEGGREVARKQDLLKDPFGYKQDISDVVVRSGIKSNVTASEVLERVSAH